MEERDEREWRARPGLRPAARGAGDQGGLTGLDPDRLAGTVERFDTGAHKGKHLDFGRGESAYDNYHGDPILPDPDLAVLDKPPTTRSPSSAGDLGTEGGLLTDARARVLREDGTAIGGLYTGKRRRVRHGRDLPGRVPPSAPR
ncbi:FAD-binding protein [Streptomyces eurythermus]|uniref:FAD-binding protein n=1 Tax=Streptomyces eurythermus TaxID=42237 RepID=UPI0036F9E3F7